MSGRKVGDKIGLMFSTTAKFLTQAVLAYIGLPRGVVGKAQTQRRVTVLPLTHVLHVALRVRPSPCAGHPRGRFFVPRPRRSPRRWRARRGRRGLSELRKPKSLSPAAVPSHRRQDRVFHDNRQAPPVRRPGPDRAPEPAWTRAPKGRARAAAGCLPARCSPWQNASRQASDRNGCN